MAMREKVIVIKKRDVNTYAELWHASAYTLAVGQAEPTGSAWQFLSSAMLTAFAFEACINHMGHKIDNAWGEVESFSPSDKLTHLSKILQVNFPEGAGRRPLQTLSELFEFRNSLAHGKTQTLEPPAVERDNNEKLQGFLGDRPRAHWERLVASACTALALNAENSLRLERSRTAKVTCLN